MVMAARFGTTRRTGGGAAASAARGVAVSSAAAEAAGAPAAGAAAGAAEVPRGRWCTLPTALKLLLLLLLLLPAPTIHGSRPTGPPPVAREADAKAAAGPPLPPAEMPELKCSSAAEKKKEQHTLLNHCASAKTKSWGDL